MHAGHLFPVLDACQLNSYTFAVSGRARASWGEIAVFSAPTLGGMPSSPSRTLRIVTGADGGAVVVMSIPFKLTSIRMPLARSTTPLVSRFAALGIGVTQTCVPRQRESSPAVRATARVVHYLTSSTRAAGVNATVPKTSTYSSNLEVPKTSSFAVGRGRSRAVARCRRRGSGGIP